MTVMITSSMDNSTNGNDVLYRDDNIRTTGLYFLIFYIPLHIIGCSLFYRRRHLWPIQQRSPMWVSYLNLQFCIHFPLFGVSLLDESLLPCAVVWWNALLAVATGVVICLIRMILVVFHWEATADMLRLEEARQNGKVQQWRPGWWTYNRRYMQTKHGRRLAICSVGLVIVILLILLPWTPSGASCWYNDGTTFRTGIFLSIIILGMFASGVGAVLAIILGRHGQDGFGIKVEFSAFFAISGIITVVGTAFYIAYPSDHAAALVLFDLALGCCGLSMFTWGYPLTLSFINEWRVARAVKQAEEITSVEQLLPIPEGYQAFLAFCAKEFASECVLFWKRCDDFKKLAQQPLTPNGSGGGFGNNGTTTMVTPPTPMAANIPATTPHAIHLTTTTPNAATAAAAANAAFLAGGHGINISASGTSSVPGNINNNTNNTTANTTPVPPVSTPMSALRALASDSSAGAVSTPSTHRLQPSSQHGHNPTPLSLAPTTSSPLMATTHLAYASTATNHGHNSGINLTTPSLRVQRLHTGDSMDIASSTLPPPPPPLVVPSPTAGNSRRMTAPLQSPLGLLSPTAINNSWSAERIQRLQYRLGEATTIVSLFITRGSVHELNISHEMRRQVGAKLTMLHDRFATLSTAMTNNVPAAATSPHNHTHVITIGMSNARHGLAMAAAHGNGTPGANGSGAMSPQGAMSPMAAGSTNSSPTEKPLIRPHLWPVPATAHHTPTQSMTMMDTFTAIDTDLMTIFDLPLQVAINLMNRNNFTRFRHSMAFKQFLARLQSWTQGGLKVRNDRASQIGSVAAHLHARGGTAGDDRDDARSLILHTALSAAQADAAGVIDEPYHTPLSKALPSPPQQYHGITTGTTPLPLTPTPFTVDLTPSSPPPPITILPGTASRHHNHPHHHHVTATPPRVTGGSGIMVSGAVMMPGSAPMLAPPSSLVSGASPTNSIRAAAAAAVTAAAAMANAPGGTGTGPLRLGAGMIGASSGMVTSAPLMSPHTAKRALSYRPSHSEDDSDSDENKDDDHRIIPLSS